MNRFYFICGFFFILLTSFSSPTVAQDQLGVYFDAEGTTTSVTTNAPYGQVPAWVQLTDASATSSITAYEFRLEVHSDGPDPILVWTLPANALNLLVEPSFMVGLGNPLPISSRITLAQVLIMVPEAGQTVWLTVHPLNNPSMHEPPGSGYPVCNPAYATTSKENMVAMVVASGCDSEPVASINPDDNPPSIQTSGLPPSIEIEKDWSKGQIESILIRNTGEVSFSGVAYATGETPIMFFVDDLYYTEGPVSFQVVTGLNTRITPYYDGSGSNDALVVLEVCGERWNIPVGNPNTPFGCTWSVETLEFEGVDVGQRSYQDVQLTNTSYQVLPVPEIIEVPNFRLEKTNPNVTHLNIGNSCTYRVNFEPVELGYIQQVVSIGEQLCSINLIGTGLDGPPVCARNHSIIDFGTQVVGEGYIRKSFFIQNLGGGLLEGTVSLDDSAGVFSLVGNSAGDFALTLNETKQVYIDFHSDVAGNYIASVDLGVTCNPVELRARAVVLLPECTITPAELDFGTFVLGSHPAQMNFVVKNTGGGIVEGSGVLIDPSGAFTLDSYSGPDFQLPRHSNKNFHVKFDPPGEGTFSAEVDLGLSCGNMVITGVAVDLPPECRVNYLSSEHPDFIVGQFVQRSRFSLENLGGGLLTGDIELNDVNGAFSLSTYSGSHFALAHGEGNYFQINFSPLESGVYTAEVNFGNDCDPILLTRTAIDLPPQCLTNPQFYGYPDFIIGGPSRSQYFSVKNTGGGDLEGEVSISDPDSPFTVNSSGNNTYSLTYLQSHGFRVSYNPTEVGSFTAQVILGDECDPINITGMAVEMEPQCELSGYNLHNGVLTINPIPVGGSKSGYFRIRNSGGGTLGGEVSIEDETGAFEIFGDQQYALNNSGIATIVVKFSPQFVGPASTILHTNSLCGDIIIEAVGEESYSNCSSYFYGNVFDRVAVGDTAIAHVFIRNSGYTELQGELSVEGEGFQFENPGSFNLAVGENVWEELWFIPQTVGELSAIISTGIDLCQSQWDLTGTSVPAGSDVMGYYIDTEGTDNTLDINTPKAVAKAYLVLHNPSAQSLITKWAVNFWTNGPVDVLEDWNSYHQGNLSGNSNYYRFVPETPIPMTETMVLADFSVYVSDQHTAGNVEFGYGYYKFSSESYNNYVSINHPVSLMVNSSKNLLEKRPATPVASWQEKNIELIWPVGIKNFEGYHVYRRVGLDPTEKITVEAVLGVEGLAQFVDTNVPVPVSDDPSLNSEIHYSIVSIYKGKEGRPSLEVSLEQLQSAPEIVIPARTRLVAIYPNPFNPETHISFETSQPTRVQIKIYDVSGRLVRNLVDEHFEAGQFEEIWNGRDNAGRMSSSNVYYARMIAAEVLEMRKMTLLK